MVNLRFQYNHLLGFLTEEELHLMQDEADISYGQLVERAGRGSEFLGWIDLPSTMDESLISRIEADAKLIREKAEILVVIGIGGYSLGARAITEALSSPFAALYPEPKQPVVLYAGHNLSQDYHADLLKLLDTKEYAIVVVSRSGTTTEPTIAFRLLKNHLIKKYGQEEAACRIIAITDATKGALKALSEKQGYKTYVLPDHVGGRFSVLSPVGLLPVAIAGYNIRQLLQGASEMRKVCLETSSFSENPAAMYAAIRTSLYRMGKQIEILVTYEPSLHYFAEWWKHLFGESDGKENEGLFPACADFTGDLHTLGQYIQEGQRMLFETVIHVEKPKRALAIPHDDSDLDGLNYMAGKTVHEVNDLTALGTSLAHIDGDVPNLDIYLSAIDERSLGELIYFFEFACGIGGYLSGINPFDQPGLDAYKNNMFALLRKPGYENETEAIRERINED
jgi:glucose-6-phosphate isomerase